MKLSFYTIIWTLPKIQHYAELVRIKLEQRIREKKIVLPDKLSIRVKENDDNSYSVLPVLLKKHKENYSPIVDAGFDESFAKKNIRIGGFKPKTERYMCSRRNKASA